MPFKDEHGMGGFTGFARAASAWLQRRFKNLKRPAKPRRAVLVKLGLAAGLIAVLGYGYWAINRPLDFGEQTWVIKPGDTLGQVAAQLVERDVIAHALPLKLLAYKGDRGRHIRSGEYRIPPQTSLKEFLRRIVNGKGQVGIKVTIIEGWTFREMRAHLKKARKLKHDTAGMSDQQIMAKLGHPDLHPEGRFFPDTYSYATGQSDLSVYRAAFDLMREKLDFAWEKRAPHLKLANRDEALILASIIEKESWIAEEKRKIAGVFYNRLAKKMRLQTDPTVIYGLGPKFNGNLTRAHIKIDTIYNTYTRKGLPPTPISLPGADALTAAVRPAPTKAYYFVASVGGRHQFSETLAEHNRAVRAHVRRYKNAQKKQ